MNRENEDDHHHGIPLMILTTLLIQPGYVWDDRLSCTHDPDEMEMHGSGTREGERKKQKNIEWNIRYYKSEYCILRQDRYTGNVR